MEKRNLTPLRNVLVRYLVVCGGGSLVILLVWWGLFMSLIRNCFCNQCANEFFRKENFRQDKRWK